MVQDFATIHSRTQVRYIEVVQWGKLSQVATGGTILTDTWSLNVLTSHWAGFDDPFINQGFGIGSRIFVLSRERERISQCSNLGAAQNVARVFSTFRRLFSWPRSCLRIPHLQMDQDVCGLIERALSSYPLPTISHGQSSIYRKPMVSPLFPSGFCLLVMANVSTDLSRAKERWTWSPTCWQTRYHSIPII